MDEVEKLKEEIALLKEQFKKKCDKLKKANERIKYLIPKYKRREAWEESKHLMGVILRDLTSHLDQFVYKVTYEYDNKTYTEQQIQSFGTKWLKESLLMHLCDKHNLVLYHYEVTIISAQKLW